MLKYLCRLLICFISIQLCVGGACASGLDEDCSNTPCTTPEGGDYGLYCKSYTEGPINTKKCAQCSRRPNGATFTGDSNSGDNCPWKMDCPNKEGFDHGTWKPDEPTITYSGTGDQPDCEYDQANITCENGYYLDTTDTPTCSPCTKPSNADYDGPGTINNNPNSCPWTMTCPVGTYFNEGQSACKSCDPHYEQLNSFIVTYDGTRYYYDVTQCTGKTYQICLYDGKGSSTPNCPNKYYETYGVRFYERVLPNREIDLLTLPKPLWSKDFLGYYYNDNTQIFDQNGSLTSSHNNFTLEPNYDNNTKILLKAKWGSSVKSFTFYLINEKDDENEIYRKTCQYGDSGPGFCTMDISDIVSQCAENNQSGYYINTESFTERNVKDSNDDVVGTIRGDGNGHITFIPPSNPDYTYPNTINILLSPGMTPELLLTCPQGHYCNACQKHKCPFGSTADSTGEISIEACVFNGTTKFKGKNSRFSLNDSNANTIPLSEKLKQKATQTTTNP